MKAFNSLSSKRKIGERYITEAFTYDCSECQLFVELKAIWYLDTDMGCGSLMAKSSNVICSRAASCESLKNGDCPLSKGFGDELNKLNVIVMQDEIPFEVNFKGQKLSVLSSPSMLNGQFIWFGKTTVFNSEDEVSLHQEK